jgi:hypothetical protein
MEIQYEKFNQLKETVYSVPNYLPENMYPGAYVCFREGIPNSLNEDDNTKIMAAADEIDTLLNDNIFYDLHDEIDLNVVHIGTNDGVIRYLTHLKEQARHFREMLEAYFDFDYYASAESKIEEREWLTAGRREYKAFMTGIVAKVVPGGYYLTDEEHRERERLKANIDVVSDPVGYLLDTYLSSIKKCRELYTKIDDHIQAIENPNRSIVYEHELIANTHKLILFHKMDLFEPLYTKYRAHIGVVRFAKLIGTLLGIPEDKHESFRKSLDDFITETFLKPTNKKTVATPAAERKVDAYLTEIGLINAK